jgi:hypothetical protein
MNSRTHDSLLIVPTIAHPGVTERLTEIICSSEPWDREVR